MLEIEMSQEESSVLKTNYIEENNNFLCRHLQYGWLIFRHHSADFGVVNERGVVNADRLERRKKGNTNTIEVNTDKV